MHWEDRRRPYLDLRGTLHALRDYLVPDEAAYPAAQLPLLVRGVFYGGWDPSRTPATERGRDDFLARVVAESARADPTVEPVGVTRTVLRVLSGHVTGGEIDDVRQSLPKDVCAVWPEAA